MAQKVRAKDQLAASTLRCLIRWPPDERLECSQACGCPTSECDGLTCGTVVSTTAQDHGGISNPTVELAAGGCAKAQAAPKVHHSNKSSGLRHECTPSGQHSRKKPVAQKGQHEDPRSTRVLTIKDPTVIAQSQSKDDGGTSPHVLEEETPQVVYVEVNRLQHSEGMVPRQPVEINSQEIT